jgi:hypothetical protein
VTGTDLCHQWDHLTDGFAVERSVGHLRTDMTLPTDEVKQRLIQYPFDRVLVEIDVRSDSDLNGLRPTNTGGQKSDLSWAVHDNSSDPDAGGLAKLARSCGRGMHDDSVRVHASDERGRELVTELTPRPAPSSATHCATAVVRSAFPASTNQTSWSVAR